MGVGGTDARGGRVARGAGIAYERAMSTRARSVPSSVDPAEIERFDRLARDWWDPNGPMRPLHQINPVRLAFIRDEACRHFRRDLRAPFALSGLSALDVGCGAGLLFEPLARLGAAVTGLDRVGPVIDREACPVRVSPRGPDIGLGRIEPRHGGTQPTSSFVLPAMAETTTATS